MKYTPASFTKNFSWSESYGRLHSAIEKGFAGSNAAVTRAAWRSQSDIQDRDRELIPLNFFLYSRAGIEDDFVLIDQLVDASRDPYNIQFAQLALFAFHLANSGSWRNSEWADGRVAGWANDLIREAWLKDDWISGAFTDTTLKSFIEQRIVAEPSTHTKILTNYRYMLRSAGVLVKGQLAPANLAQRWLVDAVQLFWDRQVFDGLAGTTTKLRDLEESLIENEIYKLLRCSKDQCRVFARAAYPEFADGQALNRVKQIDELKHLGRIAA